MPQWKNFDHWWVKVVAFVAAVGCLWWMGYATWWHYHLEHVCKCPVSWDSFPFIISLLLLIFSLGILARKLTEGGASIVMPFVTLVIERFGTKKEVTMTVKPPAPGQVPAGTVTVTPDPTTEIPDRGDKP